MPPTDEDIAWFQSTFRPIPKPTLPDDCIEYSIFVVTPSSSAAAPALSDKLDDTSNERDSTAQLSQRQRDRLRDVQKYANKLHKQWLKDYIWQRQGFSLEIQKEFGLTFLRGRTEYGDSIEDEWVVVWLLREVTKKFDDVWVKVTDTDGEFLLIEASGTIPAWLEPEVAENRVWINQGRLKIVQPAGARRSTVKRTLEKLGLQDAFSAILTEPQRILHSISIEEEAFYRLRNYPGQIKQNMHRALVQLPRKVAYLLLQKPAYISPAIEAFYLRDPIALKPLQQKDPKTSLLFPPNDLVTISVKFPKVGYAQVRSQEFPAPPAWKPKMPSKLDNKDYTRADTGMKLTSGFEMLLTDSHHQDRQPVREMKMLLEDLESGDEHLPTDNELEQLEREEDDEKWLDIDFADLENELGGKGKADSHGKKKEFGDKVAQENLQRIVKQFEEFLNNDKGGVNDDGMFAEESDEEDLDSDDDIVDDEDDDDGEDKDASFDEEQFTNMMQEMMGMPPEVMKEVMSGKLDGLSHDKSSTVPDEVRARAMSRIQELDTSDEEDFMDMKQMEAELRASGALDLGSGMQKGKKSIRSLTTKSAADTHGILDAVDSDEDADDDDDFDADFARNIIQSFRSSGGLGGPAANLMSIMNEQARDSKTAGKRPMR